MKNAAADVRWQVEKVHVFLLVLYTVAQKKTQEGDGRFPSCAIY